MIRKISIRGEVFPFEERYSLPEAIALEEALGMTFGQWDAGRMNGSAKSLAGYVWMVLRRNGRDVPIADILSGKYELDIADITQEAGEGDEPGPTPPSSPSTGDATSGSSPTSSDTGPETSTDSPPMSSTT